MRDYMNARSMRGLRGGGLPLPETVLTGSSGTLSPTTAPPTARWPSTVVAKAPPTARVTSVPARTGLVAATVTPTKTPTSLIRTPSAGGGTRSDLVMSDVAMGAPNTSINSALTPSPPPTDPSFLEAGPTEGGVIYGEPVGMTRNSALSDWWARYKLWALSLGGGGTILLILWVMSRRRR